jgi:hypothetical protein
MRHVKLLATILLASATLASAQKTYLGFDKNGYPGDDLLPALHKTFAWTGYWLNNPPGMNSNPWTGKRSSVSAAGFGFLVLFNGRLDAQLKGQDASTLGREDAAAAIAAAKNAKASLQELSSSSIRKKAAACYLSKPITWAPGSPPSIAQTSKPASIAPESPCRRAPRKSPPPRTWPIGSHQRNSGSGTTSARRLPVA